MRGAGGHHCAAERDISAWLMMSVKLDLRIDAYIFTDSVKDNDGIIERVANDCHQRCNGIQINLIPIIPSACMSPNATVKITSCAKQSVALIAYLNSKRNVM